MSVKSKHPVLPEPESRRGEGLLPGKFAPLPPTYNTQQLLFVKQRAAKHFKQTSFLMC